MSAATAETEAETADDGWLIRVWFGQTVIASYTAPADVAASYAEVTRRRYRGLRVTVDLPDGRRAERLPEARQWPLTVI